MFCIEAGYVLRLKHGEFECTSVSFNIVWNIGCHISYKYVANYLFFVPKQSLPSGVSARLERCRNKRAPRRADLGKCFSGEHLGEARVRNVIAQFGKCIKRALLARKTRRKR